MMIIKGAEEEGNMMRHWKMTRMMMVIMRMGTLKRMAIIIMHKRK